MAARSPSPREVVDLLTLTFAPRYLRHLVAHRDYIREAILNPGGSIILNGSDRVGLEGSYSYDSRLDNDFYLDLLQAEMEITNHCIWCEDEPKFTPKQIVTLLEWAKNLSHEEAERSGLLSRRPGAIRRTRHHSIGKLAVRMSDGR